MLVDMVFVTATVLVLASAVSTILPARNVYMAAVTAAPVPALTAAMTAMVALDISSVGIPLFRGRLRGEIVFF